MSKTDLPADAIGLKEAGRLINLSSGTIRRWIKIGKIAGWRVGWKRFVSREDVLAQVEQHQATRGQVVQSKSEKRARDTEVDRVLREVGIRK
jgi:excisionase family DNA binding protein